MFFYFFDDLFLLHNFIGFFLDTFSNFPVCHWNQKCTGGFVFDLFSECLDWFFNRDSVFFPLIFSCIQTVVASLFQVIYPIFILRTIWWLLRWISWHIICYHFFHSHTHLLWSHKQFSTSDCYRFPFYIHLFFCWFFLLLLFASFIVAVSFYGDPIVNTMRSKQLTILIYARLFFRQPFAILLHAITRLISSNIECEYLFSRKYCGMITNQIWPHVTLDTLPNRPLRSLFFRFFFYITWLSWV